MTKMILFLTFLYILVSLPQEIYSAYFYDEVNEMNYGLMVTNIIDTLQFTYPAFHIFILYFSNKQFAIEVKDILLRAKSNRVTTMTSKT